MIKNVIVSGGNRGIGAGIVKRLSARGMNVAFSHLGERDRAQAVVAECAGNPGQVHAIDANFEDVGAPIRFFEQALELLGEADALVNNAGRGYEERLVDTRAEDIDSVYAVNFRATLLLSREIALHLITRSAPGAIVNLSSVKMKNASPIDGVYGAFKAAISRATESIALELAPAGIRVNAVAPGMIAVFDQLAEGYARGGAQVPIGRAGTPDDIACAVEFLLSEEASYITGVTLRVDGGIGLPATYGGDDIGPDNRWGRTQTEHPTSEFEKRPGLYY